MSEKPTKLGQALIAAADEILSSREINPTSPCRECKQSYVKIFKGTSPNGKKKYYVDERGKHWRGKKCPKCSRREHARYMAKKRQEAKGENL